MTKRALVHVFTVLVFALMLLGCGEKLPGTTWEGEYKGEQKGSHDTKIAIEFEALDVAKVTLTEYSQPKTEALSYAFDGKALKLTFMGIIRSTLKLENGQLVTTPEDMGIVGEKNAKIVLTKKAK